MIASSHGRPHCEPTRDVAASISRARIQPRAKGQRRVIFGGNCSDAPVNLTPEHIGATIQWNGADQLALLLEGTVKLTSSRPRWVGPEAIGDEAVRDTAAPLKQLTKEPRGGVAIPAGLEQDVDDFALLIDRPPEVLTLASNGHEEFVQMPGVADWPRAPPEPPCVSHAEGLAPVPDGLVRHGDAALGEEVFGPDQSPGQAPTTA